MKAQKSGIRGHLGTFIRNFLTELFFRVRIGHELSEWCQQTSGVPQGSVLSVTLFAMMINDIDADIPPIIGRSLFVDDFAIWSSASNTSAITRRLQLAVNKLQSWSINNGFRFSTEKKLLQSISIAVDVSRNWMLSCMASQFQ